MAVDDGAGAVDDRVVDVAAIGEHGVERGDRPAGFAVDPGAFAQGRDQCEDRRRVALHRRRFAQGQPDLALRMRDAGQAVDQQQHLLAVGAKRLGNRGGAHRGAQAQ